MEKNANEDSVLQRSNHLVSTAQLTDFKNTPESENIDGLTPNLINVCCSNSQWIKDRRASC